MNPRWFYGDFPLWSQGTPLKSLGSARFPKARKPFGGASHTALQPAADVGHCGATSEPKKIGWFHGDLKGYFIGFVMVVNGIFHGDLNQGVVHGTSWWFHQWRTRDIMGFHGNWMDNMGIQLTKCQCFPACTIFFRPIVPQHSTTFLIFPVISQMLIGYLQGETSRAIGPQTLHPGWAGAASLLHRLRLAGEEGAPGCPGVKKTWWVAHGQQCLSMRKVNCEDRC